MENFAERLIVFRLRKGCKSQSSFAREIKVKPQNVSSWENGTMPDRENLQKIKDRYPDVNIDWIVSKKGDMLLKEVPPSVSNEELSKALDVANKERDYWKSKFMEEIENKFKK